MIEKWDITIPELTGSETRKAYLYLPDYYDETPDILFFICLTDTMYFLIQTPLTAKAGA